MSFKELSPTFSAAPQLSPEDVAQAAREGFKIIVCHRHDGEDSDQPSAAEMATMVARHGMRFVHIPVTPGDVKDADVAAFVKAIGDDDVRVLGYCKTGKRAASFWALSQGGEQDTDAIIKTAAAAGYDISELRSRIVGRAALGGGGHHHKIYDIVIVGGGSGGIAAAASILKRRRDLSIAVIEPADVHYYQPGFTLIGAGVFTPDVCKRTMASVMPDRVTWIQQRVTGFAPDSNEVILEDGVSIKYRGLVASPGIKLNWAGIPGLAETLGEADQLIFSPALEHNHQVSLLAAEPATATLDLASDRFLFPAARLCRPGRAGWTAWSSYLLPLFQSLRQSLVGRLPIGRLRAPLRRRHNDPRWAMSQPDPRLYLVAVLPARSSGDKELHLALPFEAVTIRPMNDRLFWNHLTLDLRSAPA